MSIINDEDKMIPWYKEFYVWMMIFFPALAVVAGTYTIILAFQSDDGLVVDDYYKKGLEINRTLERDQIAVDKQLKVVIELDSQLEEVSIMLTAAAGFVYPESLPVSFLHATRAGLDKEANLILVKENVYRGNLPKLNLGKWYVYIQYDDWRLINTINVSK